MDKGEFFEQCLSKKAESLQNSIEDEKFLTVYEMFISELVVELFRQLSENSPFDHMKDNFVPYEINKRRKSKSLLPVTIDRTQLKMRSLKNAVTKTYNWLKSCDLMRQKVESSTNAQVNTPIVVKLWRYLYQTVKKSSNYFTSYNKTSNERIFYELTTNIKKK